MSGFHTDMYSHLVPGGEQSTISICGIGTTQSCCCEGAGWLQLSQSSPYQLQQGRFSAVLHPLNVLLGLARIPCLYLWIVIRQNLDGLKPICWEYYNGRTCRKAWYVYRKFSRSKFFEKRHTIENYHWKVLWRCIWPKIRIERGLPRLEEQNAP